MQVSCDALKTLTFFTFILFFLLKPIVCIGTEKFRGEYWASLWSRSSDSICGTVAPLSRTSIHSVFSRNRTVCEEN